MRMKCVEFLEPHQAQFSVYKVFSHIIPNDGVYHHSQPLSSELETSSSPSPCISVSKLVSSASSICHICLILSTATTIFLAYQQVRSVSSPSSIPISSSFSLLPEFMFSNINLIMLIYLNSFPISYSPVSFFFFTVQFLNTGLSHYTLSPLPPASLLTHTNTHAPRL